MLLADWDWRWPPGANILPVADRWFRDPSWRRQTNAEVQEKIDELYGVLYDQPPSMERWCEEWAAGGNHFYVFIFGKLAKLRDRVLRLTSEIGDRISPAYASKAEHAR